MRTLGVPAVQTNTATICSHMCLMLWRAQQTSNTPGAELLPGFDQQRPIWATSFPQFGQFRKQYGRFGSMFGRSLTKRLPAPTNIVVFFAIYRTQHRRIWPDSVNFDNAWATMAKIRPNVAAACQILTIIGRCWPNLAGFGFCWGPCGQTLIHTWPNRITFSRITCFPCAQS